MSVEFMKDMSSSGLKKLHDAVHRAFEHDEGATRTEDKIYGVRAYQDWRIWSDALEAEMSSRGVVFNPVPW